MKMNQVAKKLCIALILIGSIQFINQIHLIECMMIQIEMDSSRNAPITNKKPKPLGKTINLIHQRIQQVLFDSKIN